MLSSDNARGMHTSTFSGKSRRIDSSSRYRSMEANSSVKPCKPSVSWFQWSCQSAMKASIDSMARFRSPRFQSQCTEFKALNKKCGLSWCCSEANLTLCRSCWTCLCCWWIPRALCLRTCFSSQGGGKEGGASGLDVAFHREHAFPKSQPIVAPRTSHSMLSNVHGRPSRWWFQGHGMCRRRPALHKRSYPSSLKA